MELRPSFGLASLEAANPGRESDFETLGAGTSEGGVIGKDDVATLLADQSAVGKHGHGRELVIGDAIGTTGFFGGDERFSVLVFFCRKIG
jgi:hypothetical protein